MSGLDFGRCVVCGAPVQWPTDQGFVALSATPSTQMVNLPNRICDSVRFVVCDPCTARPVQLKTLLSVARQEVAS